MRLLMHGINYAPELIGIGRYTGELGAWLASRGHAVTVLTAPPYYPEWRVPAPYRRRWLREWRDGVEVLRAPLYAPGQVTGRGRLLHELSFGAGCLPWWPSLMGRRWDAVLAVCPLLQSGLMPALLARRQGTPFIFHFQDLQVDAARELGILRQSLLLAAMARLERFLLRRAAAVTTISQAMAARLQEKGVPAARLHLLPNWADVEHIRPAGRGNRLRQELGLRSETVVLYAGSMGEKQGLEIILEAAVMTRDHAAIRYVLAGEGGAKPRLLTEARRLGLDKVMWLPVQSEADLPLLLAAGDIHLVVQKQKASDLVMPSKLANILAAGRPFIATAGPDTELGRVTRDSLAGVLVPPEDPHALVRAILELAAGEEKRERMGVKARMYAETWLDRQHILARWEALLLRLIHGGGNGDIHS